MRGVSGITITHPFPSYSIDSPFYEYTQYKLHTIHPASFFV